MATYNASVGDHRRTRQPMSGEQCRCCGASNVAWAAPSPLWNEVMRGGSIDGPVLFDDLVCLNCFAELAETKGIASGWRLIAEDVNVPLQTVTPSGRTWSDEAFLWIDPVLK